MGHKKEQYYIHDYIFKHKRLLDIIHFYSHILFVHHAIVILLQFFHAFLVYIVFDQQHSIVIMLLCDTQLGMSFFFFRNKSTIGVV